jgi:hypothetical protein
VLGTVHRSFVDSNAHDCMPPFLVVPTRPSQGELHDVPTSYAGSEVRKHRLRDGGPMRRCRAVVERRSPSDNPARKPARPATLLRNPGGWTLRMYKGPAQYENCMSDAQVSTSFQLLRM